MIDIIIQSFWLPLLCVGAGAVCLFAAGLYFILKPKQASTVVSIKQTPVKTAPASRVSAAREMPVEDLSAISGDDVLATQLHLARAFIETGKSAQARGILQHVMKQGNRTQQQEAERLMQTI